MVKYTFNDKVFKKVYTITGKTNSLFGRKSRYIQISSSGKPCIATSTGYSAHNVIVFTDIFQAANFLRNFTNSKLRKTKKFIDWEVVEYKPWGNTSKYLEYKLNECFDSDYGYYYRPKLISNKSTNMASSKHTDSKVSLDSKLDELNYLVLEVKSLVNKDEEMTTNEAIDKVKNLISKYDIRINEVFSEDDILDYVQSNFYPEDIVKAECYPDYHWR